MELTGFVGTVKRIIIQDVSSSTSGRFNSPVSKSSEILKLHPVKIDNKTITNNKIFFIKVTNLFSAD